jgi:hypothetical protein
VISLEEGVDFFCSDFGENGYSPLKYERGILCLVDRRDPSRGEPESSGHSLCSDTVILSIGGLLSG